MIDSVKWYIDGQEMIQPTEYEIEIEDLDNQSYRSITTGNLIDNVISKNWSKCKFKFEAISKEKAFNLIQKCSKNPINAKIENPIYASGFVEAKFRCSKKSIKKVQSKNALYDVTLNLVQKNKIGGM